MDKMIKITNTVTGSLPAIIDDDYINSQHVDGLVTLTKQDRLIADILIQGIEAKDIWNEANADLAAQRDLLDKLFEYND